VLNINELGLKIMETPVSARDNIDLHATQHPLVFSENFATLEAYCLYILHQKDYEKAAELVPSCRVLDLGCNNGYGSYELSRHGHEVIGVDVSADALADARRRFHAASLEFRQVNGLELPFDSNQFDLVTSFQVIEHIIDMDAYLNEIWRVLKPGGIVVFTTPNAAIRLDPDMKPWNRFHIQEFTPSRLEALLRPTFAQVKLRGQFAKDEIYRLEFERCQRGLQHARTRSSSRFALVRGGIEAILPNPIVEFVSNRINPRSPPRASPRKPTAADRQRLVREGIKAILPSQIVEFVSSQLNRHSPGRASRRAPTATDRERLTTKEVFYREWDLERALNLMAVCSK
jgi:2-polyprenyl-3-methyl-5-hydroxy-6-metoxy-1,4-benzoquinol methylase